MLQLLHDIGSFLIGGCGQYDLHRNADDLLYVIQSADQFYGKRQLRILFHLQLRMLAHEIVSISMGHIHIRIAVAGDIVDRNIFVLANLFVNHDLNIRFGRNIHQVAVDDLKCGRDRVVTVAVSADIGINRQFTGATIRNRQ